jgi:hypothetical protein
MLVFKGRGGEEEAVGGFNLGGSVLAFKDAASAVQALDPRTATRTKRIQSFSGLFFGSSRARPHPTNPDLALVFHPLARRVAVVDYAIGRTIPLVELGSQRNALAAANWIDDRQFIVATFSAPRTSNTVPFHPTAAVGFTRYDWDEKLSTASVIDQNTVTIALNGVFPWRGMQRAWGDFPLPLDANWWSFDVDRQGNMVTAMFRESITTDAPVTEFTQVLNCRNQTRASITEQSRTVNEYYVLRVSPSGGINLGEPMASTTNTVTARRIFDVVPPPQSPNTLCSDILVRQELTAVTTGEELTHVDITPGGTLALTLNRVQTNRNGVSMLIDRSTNTWQGTGEFNRSQTWTAHGTLLASATRTEVDQIVFVPGRQTLSSSTTFDVGDINIYDVQYDGRDTAWATWVTEGYRSDDLVHRASFFFGNDFSNTTLFQTVDPFREFGLPVFPADVITDPYNSGAIAVVQILSDEPKTWFVNYLDGQSSETDLVAIEPIRFNGAQEFQFLP